MPLDRDVPEAAPPAWHDAPERAVDLSCQPSFQRDVQALHDLGPRALAELLAEIIVDVDAQRRRWLLGRLAAYRGLPQEALAATGGDRFPAMPIRVVK